MNANRLLALYDHVANAPDAIHQLRRFVLDLAVRGKLIEQDPNDEPASALLERITAEKAKLTGKRKLYVASATYPDSAHQLPFNLPAGWAETTIGGICSKTGSGSTPKGGKKAYAESGIVFLRSQNIYNDGLRLTDVAYIDPATYKRMSGTAVRPSDLLLNITGGSIGRCCLVPDDLDQANVSQHVSIIRIAVDGPQRFLHYVILAPYFQTFILDEQTGAGRGGLPKYKMDRIPVALPPLAEQQRIVARVEELMALCDRLEEARLTCKWARAQLSKITLDRLSKPDADTATFRSHARFTINSLPALTARIDQIKNLRRTILDLAVRGRLVEQNPEDEPAEKLLKRITAEKLRLIETGKIRKQKFLPPIEEPPFHIPQTWLWARIREITSDRGQKVPETAFTYIDVTAIDKENGLIVDPKVLRPSEAPSRARKIVQKGDLIYSCVRPYLLNVAIVNNNFDPAPIASTAFAILNGHDLVLPGYLWIALCSPFMVTCVEQSQRGQAYPAINDSDFALLPFPLPPLAEQHRIVSKVDKLMTLCNGLETGLSTVHANRSHLLESVLRAAL